MINKLVKALLSVSVALPLLSTSALAASNQSAELNRYIVKLSPQAQSLVNSKQALSQSLGVNIQSVEPMAAGLTLLVVQQQGKEGERLNQSSLIEYAVKDRKTTIKPIKPMLMQGVMALSHELQWDQFTPPAGTMLESAAGLKDGAWQYSLGETFPPVVVAIVDTGVELNPRLTNNFLYDNNNNIIGWNFANNNADFSDETGSYHGTHVAGTIAAGGNDVFGMGPKLKILPVKIPDASGMFYESAVINGIYWALGEKVPGVPTNPYPAKVMNMSFGIDEGPGKEVDSCDAAVQSAIDFANNKGAVMVVAAGNNDLEDDLGAPAGCKGTIRVSSTDPSGLKAYYSNFGKGVTYAAPGGDKRHGMTGAILSTVKPGTGINGSGLAFMQGTSMASPHVAGLFGLVFAMDPTISSETAKKIVYSTTHDFGENGSDENACRGKKSCGHGIIDADAALAAIDANYHFILNSPKLSQLALTSEGCASGQVRASAEKFFDETAQAEWQLEKNACVSKSDLDFPNLMVMDYSVSANFGAIKYKIYPHGHCNRIGWDGVGCHQ